MSKRILLMILAFLIIVGVAVAWYTLLPVNDGIVDSNSSIFWYLIVGNFVSAILLFIIAISYNNLVKKDKEEKERQRKEIEDAELRRQEIEKVRREEEKRKELEERELKWHKERVAREQDLLTQLFDVVKTLDSDSRCRVAISNSKLVIPSLIVGGEYLYIPYGHGYSEGGKIRYDFRFNEIDAIESAAYSRNMESYLFLDNIARYNLNNDSKYLYYVEKYSEIKNLKKIDGPLQVQFDKIHYLYQSLLSVGVARVNNEDAFLLLAWDEAYKELLKVDDAFIKLWNEILQRILDSTCDSKYYRLKDLIKDASVNDMVGYKCIARIMLVEMNKDVLISNLAVHMYLCEKVKLFGTVYSEATQIVENAYVDTEKELYVESLLTSKPGKRVDMNYIDKMNPYMFERLVAKIYAKNGYETQVTKSSGDQGVDVIASKPGECIAIQAKLYSNPVGNSAIQEVVAGMKIYGANRACVITNSTFTASAVSLARAHDVELYDRAGLQSILDKIKILVNDFE